MALGIVKYAHDRSSQLIGVIWFAVSLSRSVVVNHLFITSSSSHFFSKTDFEQSLLKKS